MENVAQRRPSGGCIKTDPSAARPPFGHLLRRFRLAAGLSQEALAERAGVSWRTISDLERGVKHEPRGSTLRLLADGLAVGAEDRAALWTSVYPPDEAAVPRTGPPATISSNLPIALTSFVGREREMGTVRQLLGGTRLLTLTGAGGCGKTRLALEVARTLAGEGGKTVACTDGIWLVELAALSEGALVPRAVANVLGVRERHGQALLDSLTTVLRPKQALLLLDNCEHLLVACARLADALLRICPRLTILATSREALGIGGEQRWRVPSFDLPAPLARLTLDRTIACDAVRLFVQRARVVHSDFALTAENMALVALICRRLDGMPLAIELAAARLSAIALDQLAARLDDRFRLLTGGSHTVLPRQQTLRATLDWSHDLLDERQQLLLRRLAVFAGGWTLEAAEFVCAADGVAADEVLDLLAGLVAKSLVLLEDGRTGARYRMLETVRQYGREKLGAEEEIAVRDRHLDWYLALTRRAASGMGGVERAVWLERLEVELENLRTALHRSSREEGWLEAGLHLATGLEDFWYMRGHAVEGRRWLEDLLRRGDASPAALRARALHVLALLAFSVGHFAQAMTDFEAAYAMDRVERNVPGASWAVTQRGMVAIHLGNYDHATMLLEDVLPTHREHGDRHGVGWTLCYLAEIRHLQGDYARAAALYEESLAIFQEVGDAYGVSDQLGHLAHVARDRGNYGEAKRLYRESLHARRILMEMPGISECFEGLAMVAAAEGQWSWAARLFGEAHCLRETIGAPVYLVHRAAYDTTVADVHLALGDDAFAAAWATGHAMPLDEAITQALEEAVAE